ncbi:MAG TPA: Ig-like domain-containing protein, partial [Thermoanaerobaculia bacterium]|nr:Ig-like domain-containing protein [Thermoanaerobaculia bacterium]
PAEGGHALTVIAQDVAGNETRIDRSFVVGGGAGSPCILAEFDPPDGSSVFAGNVKLMGHAPGAAGVLVDGVAATLSEGTFAVQLPLTREGANPVAISCTDDSGAPVAEGSVSMTLFRVTGAPSVTIDAPARNQVTAETKLTVSGSVSADALSGDVNGVPFTPAAGHYSVPGIALSRGANLIVARARNGAGRVGVATASVIRSGAPQIFITSPLPASQTGGTSIDVSGTYANVAPATLVIDGSAVTPRPISDTTGTFVAASVPLLAGGTTHVTVSGRSAGGQTATASIDVESAAGLPSIAIENPPDNTYYGPSPADVACSGAVSAIGGSIVQVNGVQVPADAGRFSSTTALGAAGVTPVIARVTLSDGSSAADTVRLIRLGPLTIKDSFPAAGASDVDPGSLLLVLFSNPIDAPSARSSVTLTGPGDQPVGVVLFVDHDAVAVTPNVPLSAGTAYSLRVSTVLKDAAGTSLGDAFTLPFTTAAMAPAASPILDQADSAGCFDSAGITGTASVAGARVRLDLDGVTRTTLADADRRFAFDLRFSGSSGFHIARIRELGADGTLSPEATVCYRITCAGPRVVSAGLDRAAKRLTIAFSEPVLPASLVASPGGTILLAPTGGASFAGMITLNPAGDTATVAYDPDLGTGPLTLTVTNGVNDMSGVAMAAAYTQVFEADSGARTAGMGWVSGAVYDASTGRPMPGANIAIGGATIVTDVHGRYAKELAEGPYVIEATALGFTTVWRQIVVRAGATSVPLDVRLTRRGATQMTGAELTLSDGGDDAITRRAQARIDAGALPPGRAVGLTAVGAQGLAAPLPLGWSPVAAAEIAVDGDATPEPLSGSTLTFLLSAEDVAANAAATQTLSVIQYDSSRDEWRVVAAVAPLAGDGTVVVDVLTSGDYAVVFPDRGPSLAVPPPPHTGAVLEGVGDPCGAAPDVCRPANRSFTLDPAAVAPDGRTVATLIVDGSKPYPSGTAVQATIDEQLNLADGRVVIDPPFTTDLLLYRAPAGDVALVRFHLAPSRQATAATLRDGVDHIVISDHPGRIDRGALIGPEGGRVSGGDEITLEIPRGATVDPIHASVTPMTDFGAFGAIAGFHIVGGFTLSLSEAGSSTPGSLLQPARATLTVETAKFATANRQVVVAEVLTDTPFGLVIRLAAITERSTTSAASNVTIFTTKTADSSVLPLDGITREGTWLVLAADSPVAYAFGQVRIGLAGPVAANARVTALALGVTDLSRAAGTFVVPVQAAPAVPFTLQARSVAIGDGPPAVFTVAPAADAIVPLGDLILTSQPPHLLSVSPADGAMLDPGSPFQVQATFDVALDPAAASAAIAVQNRTTGAPVEGIADSAAGILTFHSSESMQPATEYRITILPSLLGVNGAPFGRTAVSRFATRNVPVANTAIHPERIRITLPDSNGRSVISGRAGALPASSQAVAVRRVRQFVEQYQATVSPDGSFSFDAGGASDAITTDDAIDLHVIDAISHATIATLPLTPFTTDDGRGFLAGPTQDVHFVTPDDITVDVPAGAFETPTIVSVSPGAASSFSGVPSFSADLAYGAGVDVAFPGMAKKRIDIQVPVLPNATPGKPFYLGYLGQSIRGPRVMIVDTLRLENGHFTTMSAPGVSSAGLRPASVRGASLFSSSEELKEGLLGVLAPGTYVAVQFTAATAWAVIDAVPSGADVFWNIPSLFASALYVAEGNGRIVVPVGAGSPFQVDGVDSGTGLDMFHRVYDPLPEGEPIDAVGLPSPIDNVIGPYPVFASPARIELVDLPASGITLTSVRNFEITLERGIVRIVPSASPL